MEGCYARIGYLWHDLYHLGAVNDRGDVTAPRAYRAFLQALAWGYAWGKDDEWHRANDRWLDELLAAVR